MADNSLSSGGDNIRDIDRLGGGVKTQVVQLDYGGNNANAETLVTTANPLPIQPAATLFLFSANGTNSSTTQLGAGQTFIGAVESIQSQQTISILATSDQLGELTLIEFIDAAGLLPCNTIVESITPGVPYSEAYTANGNYFQAQFENIGASPTTKFNLNVAYGTLPAVTSLGNGQVALNEIGGKAISGTVPVTVANDPTPVLRSHDDLLTLILLELRIMNTILSSEFRTRDEISILRADPTILNN